MKILLVHNSYQEYGGEDVVFGLEGDLLRQNGNIVIKRETDNQVIKSVWSKLKAGWSTIFFSGVTLKTLHEAKINSVDLVHVHNYFPQISPYIFWFLTRKGIPSVHTLHNYRAICPTSTLMYKNRLIDRSIHGSCWWALIRKVYKKSFIGTFLLCCMIEIHKKIGTWRFRVDKYIVLSDFEKNKYVEAGWPEEKIVVKPNFTRDPYLNTRMPRKKGGYALFVGRLSWEKGIDILVKAWENLNMELKIVGAGPLEGSYSQSCSSHVSFLGVKSRPEVTQLMRDSDFIIVPSVSPETFGMVAIEAFSTGTPVICSRIGALSEIVEDGVTGLHFTPGNQKELEEKVHWLVCNLDKARVMGKNARRRYLECYTPERNYEMLIDIYRKVIAEVRN
jgi:glycosyltransferase involved in cell wall biosynthesis